MTGNIVHVLERPILKGKGNKIGLIMVFKIFEVKYLGGIFLRSTNNVCEIKFENRGPITTNSSNLEPSRQSIQNSRNKWEDHFTAHRQLNNKCRS